jgi:hypothetical protein
MVFSVNIQIAINNHDPNEGVICKFWRVPFKILDRDPRPPPRLAGECRVRFEFLECDPRPLPGLPESAAWRRLAVCRAPGSGHVLSSHCAQLAPCSGRLRSLN